MNRTKINIFPAIVIATITLSAVSCAKKENTQAAQKTQRQVIRVEPKPSSIALIIKDFQDQKIDYPTCLLYQVYAFFKTPDMPAQYKSNQMSNAGDRLFSELSVNWDKLPQPVREKIKPFLLDPFDPQSYFYKHWQGKPQAKFNLVEEANAALSGPPAIPNVVMQSFSVAGNKVKIWYQPQEKALAETVKTAFETDKVYDKFKGLLGTEPLDDNNIWGIDKAIDIYFAEFDDVGYCWGQFTAPDSRKSRPVIFLNPKASSGDKLKSILAHELFHAFQFNIDCREDNWWKEATAAWSEHFIYPSTDREQEFLDRFFPIPNIFKSLNTSNDYHEYGAYVFPLFLSQAYNDQMIAKIWKACAPANVTSLTAINSQIPEGLPCAFKEFSLWAFNQPPTKKFKDAGRDLPAEPFINYCFIPINLTQTRLLNENTEPLGMAMSQYSVEPSQDKNIRTVTFKMDKFFEKYPFVGVWAIVKIKNKDPYLEDWTGLAEMSFCRDIPEEDFQEIFLIMPNTSTTETRLKTDDIEVLTEKTGCQAKLTLSWIHGGGMKMDNHFGSDVQGFWNLDGSFKEQGRLNVSLTQLPHDDEEYPDNVQVYSPTGSFTGSSKSSGSGSSGIVGMFKQSGSSTLSGTASDTWKNNPKSQRGYANLRFHLIYPEETAEPSEADLNALPANMRQQYQQLMGAAEQLKRVPGADIQTEPKKNQRKVELFVSFTDMPARETASVNGQGQQTKPTTFSLSHVEVRKIFPANATDVPIDETIQIPGSIAKTRITGNLRFRK